MTNNLSVTLDLQEGLALGEVRAFVEAAAMLGATPGTAVELLELDNHDVGVVGLKVAADGGALVVPAAEPPTVVTLTRRTAGALLDALSVIEREDGDARKVLAEVIELRAALEDAMVTQ